MVGGSVRKLAVIVTGTSVPSGSARMPRRYPRRCRRSTTSTRSSAVQPMAACNASSGVVPVSVVSVMPHRLLFLPADPREPRPGLGRVALSVVRDAQQVRELPVLGQRVAHPLHVAALDEVHQRAVAGGVLAGGLDRGAGPP